MSDAVGESTIHAGGQPPRGFWRTLMTRLGQAEMGLCCALLAVLCVVVFLSVVFRTILKIPLPWSLELARYLFVWLCWLGAAVGIQRRSHFGIHLLVNALPGAFHFIARLLVFIPVALFFGAIAWYGGYLAIDNWRQASPSLGVPMTFPYAAVPVGGLLMLVHWIEVHLEDLFAKREVTS
jgi:TRAP-type C4-dicarboxylate transport system permease small subunit